MLEPFSSPYVQEGLVEILLLSVAAGLIGSWLVLRGLAFYSHAVGTASFPGLVLADGIGFPAALGAFGMAGVFTVISSLLGRARRSTVDSVTALTLVACMAAGVIMASDVFSSGANVDTLLFGSLLAIDSGDVMLAAASAVVSILAVLLLAHRWLAKGFDEGAAGSLASGSRIFDFALMAVVAFTVIATLSAVGALLVAAMMVIPAATVRMVTSRLSTLQVGSVLLVAAEGTLGLWLSVKTDAPPGATIAVVSGLVFAIVAFARAVRPSRLVASALALVALGGFAAGCGSGDDDSGKVKVAATTTQVADFVAQVGGDEIDLTGILKPNTDPHEYEPRPSDVEAVADAQIVFQSGGHLDEWADQLVDDSGSDATVVNLSADLPVELHGGEHDHEHEGEEDHADDHADEGAHAEDEHASEGAETEEGHAEESEEHADEHTEEEGHAHEGEEIDPHWWHDPVNVVAATEEVEHALAVASPENADYFQQNADAYVAQVKQLQRQIAQCVKAVPAGERKIVTDHDAFGYFTNRFGIETVGTVIPALTTQAQPSAGDLADLEETIREENVEAVFPESSVSPKLAEALSRDTGAAADYTLYGDTLGPDGSDGATWLEMMASNANNIVLGMTGGERGCEFEVS
ncbi:MAG: zinc ABC transporter substrate-binding protein [Solirubrobacterales bacterium]|nr:zinc ABC transporter substrate-binding protein [Solirubrobacterales bacterium]